MQAYGLPAGQKPAPIHALVMLPCPASSNAAAHAVRKRIASISACSANATICAHRQRRTSCEKKRRQQIEAVQASFASAIASRPRAIPSGACAFACNRASTASSSIRAAACRFSACGKNAACNKKAVQQEIIFHRVVFLRHALLCQCWRGLRAPPSVFAASKSFVPYVRYEINLLITKEITCIQALEAHN